MSEHLTYPGECKHFKNAATCPKCKTEPAYTAQDLRKRLVDEGCSCDPYPQRVHTANQCGFHSALFAYEARIRSEARAEVASLVKTAIAVERAKTIGKFAANKPTVAVAALARAGMREACAGLARRAGVNTQEEIAQLIEGLPDLAADEAIERIRAEARLKQHKIDCRAYSPSLRLSAISVGQVPCGGEIEAGTGNIWRCPIRTELE